MFHDFAKCDLAMVSSTRDREVSTVYSRKKPMSSTTKAKIDTIDKRVRGRLAQWGATLNR
jgi:hypothetical protein